MISMFKARHWSILKKGGTCFLCSIVCLLPFLPTPSILTAKIEECGYRVDAFCTGARLDWGAKEHTYGTNMIFATQGRSDTSVMPKEPCDRCAAGAGEKNWRNEKRFPEPWDLQDLERGGGEGVQGGAESEASVQSPGKHSTHTANVSWHKPRSGVP